jgi:hypothetical protein
MKSSLGRMQLSRFTRVGLVAVGVMLVGWVALKLVVSGSGTRTGPAKVDPTRCPNCGRPLPGYAQVTGECPYCQIEQGGGRKTKARGSAVTSSTTLPAVLGCAFVLLLALHVGLLLRSRVGRGGEEVCYFTNCRKCGRKLRYRDHQVGHLARCPLCRDLVRFPEPPGKAGGLWWKVKGWWKRLRRRKEAV